MKYIVHKRLKEAVICGNVNIPAQTEAESQNGQIFCDGKLICLETSEIAHQFFAENENGDGMLRGKLTQAIQKRLEKRDTNYQKRWDKIWNDSTCYRYRRKEILDFWLWNHQFFHAPIEDLRHIASLVGVKEVS